MPLKTVTLMTSEWEIRACGSRRAAMEHASPAGCQPPPPRSQRGLGWNCGTSRTPPVTGRPGLPLGRRAALPRAPCGACRKPGPPPLGRVPRRGAFPRGGQLSSPCFLRQPGCSPGLQNTRLISRGDQAVFCIHCSELSPSHKIQSLFGKGAVKAFFRCRRYR